MKISKPWIVFQQPLKTRLITTGVGLCLFLFFVFGFHWSFTNFFLIGFQILIQLFFILSNLKERLIITEKFIEYRFLFFRKKIIEPDFFLIQDTKNRHYYNELKLRDEIYRSIVIYKDDKPKIRLNDKDWNGYFNEIYNSLKSHYEEYELKEIYENSNAKKIETLIMFLVSILLFVFGLGLLKENHPETFVDKTVPITGKIRTQPQIEKYVGRGYVTYYLNFYLKEYPNIKFGLDEKGLKKIKGYEFIKTDRYDDSITLFVDQKKYEIIISKTRKQSYFSSHTLYLKRLSILGIDYEGQKILNEEIHKKDKANNAYGLALFIIFSSSLLLIFSIYWFFKKLFS